MIELSEVQSLVPLNNENPIQIQSFFTPVVEVTNTQQIRLEAIFIDDISPEVEYKTELVSVYVWKQRFHCFIQLYTLISDFNGFWFGMMKENE